MSSAASTQRSPSSLLRKVAFVAGAYAIGSIPFSWALARLHAGVDLRDVGSGTVSGTGLYRVAGTTPLVVGGTLDLLKGVAVGLAGRAQNPSLRAASIGALLVGHNWSVFLRGAGGRGIAPALGATLVVAPEATTTLGLGLALGRLADATALGTFVAQAALPPLLSMTRGTDGALLSVALVAPMWIKRVIGNAPPDDEGTAVRMRRLLRDRDS